MAQQMANWSYVQKSKIGPVEQSSDTPSFSILYDGGTMIMKGTNLFIKIIFLI